MALFSTLKRNSKLALRDNWGPAVLVLLIPAGVGVLLTLLRWLACQTLLLDPLQSNPTMDPQSAVVLLTPAMLQGLRTRGILLGILSLLGLLATAPLQLGVYGWYRGLVYGNRPPVRTVFRCFETARSFSRALYFHLQLYLRALVWGLLFFSLPSISLLLAVWNLRQGDTRGEMTLATLGFALSVVVLLLCALCYTAFMNRYALAAWLLCEDDTLGVRAALRTSVSYTSGYRLSLLLYSLSFAGWYLLSALSLGLLGLYTAPWIFTSWAMYSRYIIERGRMDAEDATREFMAQ